MEAGASQRLIKRAGWQLGKSEESARAELQRRLIVLSRMMFWAFIALFVGMIFLYRAYPEIEPKRNTEIYEVAGVGLVLLVIVWQGLLARTTLTFRQLYAIDIFYGGSAGTVFAAAAYLAPELHMASTANILWACFTVFLRSIVLPSTGTRTAIVSAVTFVPMIGTSVGLSLTSQQELPLPALVGATLLVATVVVSLATRGSQITYGLQRQVSEAKQLGMYTLGEKIGEGGNGTVYRGHHALLRRPTAIKVIRPDRIDALTIDRFEREVQEMSQLSHPNTVAVFDFGRSPEGIFYCAMEYLDGVNLEQLVGELGPQPPDRVIAILAQVCGALQEAHGRGLIHRDIKPANIILCERGGMPDIAKVVDFGLVKEIKEESSGEAKGILGTPAYLPPETIAAPDQVGPASDLYALGAVGYFLLTGRRVFHGKTTLDECLQHVTAKPIPPSEYVRTIPPGLEALVLRCLEKQPAQRPPSAAELARLLRELPPGGTWDEATAHTWWSDFRRRPKPSATAATLTITVDIGRREGAVEQLTGTAG